MSSRPTAIRYHTKVTMEWLATYLSSHAIDAYATAKLTTVPTAVGTQPTVLDTAPAAVTPSNTPAATSAGMPRKNDSRVAVTRSMPSARPALMVAPERDTPGISAKHCRPPMIAASLRVRSPSPRFWVALNSPYTITTHQMISALATTHRLRSGPSISGLAASPT